MRSRLPKGKDKIPPSNRAGGYKISCLSSDSSYVGQNGTMFESSLKGYFKRKTAEARENVITKGHEDQDMDVSMLHVVIKGRQMAYLEGIDIKMNA